MPRVFFETAYDGTDFSGWQVQPDRISVQEVIEERLAQLYMNQPIRIHSSGRTDSGVHALAQAVTYDAPDAPRIPAENIQKALNNALPDSITVRHAFYAEFPDFHARYSAVGKAYTYVINRGEQLPFSARYSWHLSECRNISAIRSACNSLTGTHDFSSFTTSRKSIDCAIRTIYRVDINEFDDFLCLTFVGSGFLYKMVRSLVGLLALIGSGKVPSSDTARILSLKDRATAPKTAPPQGLFLMKVFYSTPEMEKFSLENLPFTGKL